MPHDHHGLRHDHLGLTVTDGPERTPDGRHIVVDGRRWRASDPSIPDVLRSELVGELMAARRAVRTDGDSARHRVHDAKVALGERGHPWWEPADDDALRPRIVATLRTVLRHRDGATCCPSDIARIVGGQEWRDRMDLVRNVAFELADADQVTLTQKGNAVGRDARGPLRIGPGPRFDDER